MKESLNKRFYNKVEEYLKEIKKNELEKHNKYFVKNIEESFSSKNNYANDNILENKKDVFLEK